MAYALRYGLLFLIVLLLHAPAIAQTRTVSGQLTTGKAEKSGEGLPYGNVVILSARDSSFVKGVTSDEKGHFKISYTPAKDKRYLLKASYLGYEHTYRNLNYNDTYIGTIVLKEKDIALDEVTITAKMPETEQVGDTTVINVSVYKTPEGSYLEELVKRIPGLEYDKKENSLTYNGLPISEINVNGEPFFSGDNRMALENLPAELVSKIKVYDKKSELEKITGVRKGKENYVLDLQTKEEFNGTLLASAEVGRGSSDRKELELLGNYFRQGGDNASFIAKSDNRNLLTRYDGNIHNMAGVNMSKTIKEKFILSGNLIYNGNKVGNEMTSYNEQYLSSGNRYQSSTNESVSTSRYFNSMTGFRWEINERTYVNFNGSLSFMRMESNNHSSQSTADTNPLNDIDMHSITMGDQHQVGLMADITHLLNTKGTSISLTMRYDDGQGDNENFNISNTIYYQLKDRHGNDSVLHRNQYQVSPTHTRLGAVGLMFTQPFTEKLRMQLAYDLKYDRQRNHHNTYDLSAFMEEEANDSPGSLPDGYEAGYTDSLSNSSRSRTLAHDFTLRLNYSDEVWGANLEFSTYPERRSINQKTGRLFADTVTNTVGFRPVADFSWRKKDIRVKLYYMGDTRQPSLTDLLMLTDNSDPLNITRGNPDLKPSYHQSARLEIQNTKKGITASVNWRNELNSITRAVIYNQQTGGRESYPVNIHGNRSIGASFRYNKRIKKFRVASRSTVGYDRNVSLVNEGNTEQPQRSIARSKRFSTNLRLAYQPKWGGVDLTGDWNLRHTSNSLRQAENYMRDYLFSLNAYADLPVGIQLRSDAMYSFRNGTNIKKGEDDQFVWNAGVTWRFLNKKQAEVSLYWSDILNKKKNYTRSVTSTGVYERHNRQIGSYFMVSARYRFNQSLKKK